MLEPPVATEGSVVSIPRTGKDVVYRYATAGYRDCAKVYYATRTLQSGHGNPYELSLAPKNRIKGQDHWSISASGICSVGSDHAVDFVPSGEWLKEQSVFELLSAKRIFKTWLIAKMFKGWHYNTRRNHYGRVQKSLASQSFLAKPMFCKAVLQLRNITHEMARVQLLDIQPGKSYRLEDLSKEQADSHKVLVQPALEVAANATVTVLQQLIRNITEQEALIRRQVEAYAADPSAGASKGQSSIQIRRDWKAKEEQLQSLTIDVAKLKCIVRLADMMLCGAAVGMLMEGVTGLQARLASHAPLLVLPAFTHEGVHFEPESQQMLKCLNEDVLQPMVTCIKRLPRIMGAEGLAALWPGTPPSSTDLASIIIGNDAINSCRQWSSEVNGMEGQQQVGVVTLATAALQQDLGHALGVALDALMVHLARWLACLKRVQAQEGQRQQHQETALALWDMYLAYGGKPLPDQQDKFDEMKEDAAVFQKACADGVRFLDERKAGMVALLDRTVRDATLQLKELALAVGDCFDMDPEQAPEEALSQLEDLASQVDSLAERCTMLQACQQQFAVPQSDLKDPRELKGQLTIHCTRWNCLKRISDTQKSWMQSKWADLQPDRAKQQMQDAVDAQAQSFAEGLPEEKALQQVAYRNCQELGKMLPLVCCLAGPRASKEQYWIELFRFMDRAMPADTADCCLDQLTEDAFTALTYAEQIQSVMAGNPPPKPLSTTNWGDSAADSGSTADQDSSWVLQRLNACVKIPRYEGATHLLLSTLLLLLMNAISPILYI
ncbi:MAG: hypothetical protein FRX49_05519 [Trebouxia sp. A1-2]|nr:MAG: hypothetical protein FRX49_05519 [Trebouxia sp. A1-2]